MEILLDLLMSAGISGTLSAKKNEIHPGRAPRRLEVTDWAGKFMAPSAGEHARTERSLNITPSALI